MDTMYIIKSGDMRYTKGGGCGSRAGFSEKISLKTAHKIGKITTAEKLIAEQLDWALWFVNSVKTAVPNGDHYTSADIAINLEHAQQQLAMWKAARVVPVTLAEG
jgi:hypothetical protein